MYNTNSKAGAGLPGHTPQRYNTLSRSTRTHHIELPSCSSHASTLCVDVNAGSSMRIQRSSIVQRSSILHLLAVAFPLGAWTTLHCSRYNTSNYFTAETLVHLCNIAVTVSERVWQLCVAMWLFLEYFSCLAIPSPLQIR